MMAFLADIMGIGEIDWRKIARVFGVAGFCVLIVFFAKTAGDLAKERSITDRMLAALRNPTVVQKARTRYLKGPVVIKTLVVETPGRKETTTTEERAKEESWNESQDSWIAPTPAQLDGLRGRTSSGWVAGPAYLFGPEPLGDRFGAVGGYTFAGRLTICGELTGAKRLGLLGLWRF